MKNIIFIHSEKYAYSAELNSAVEWHLTQPDLEKCEEISMDLNKIY
jgi:hypothetical protein